MIDEGARQRADRHDALADLVRDQHERARQARQDFEQTLDLGVDARAPAPSGW